MDLRCHQVGPRKMSEVTMLPNRLMELLVKEDYARYRDIFWSREKNIARLHREEIEDIPAYNQTKVNGARINISNDLLQS